LPLTTRAEVDAMRRSWLAVVLGVAAASRAAADEARIDSPLSVAKIEAFLAEHPGASVETFLTALPDEHRQNVALVHKSRSLHRATYARPRQIFFGLDAQMLLAAGSVPTDPRYDVIEYAELDRARGVFAAGKIEFGTGAAPRLTRQPAECAACHGTPWRPIWGPYVPTWWPGVYGDNSGGIAEADVPGFLDFLATRPTEPHLRALDDAIDVSPAPRVIAKGRAYPVLNTDLGMTLGSAVATGAVVRLESHPEFDVLKWLFLDRVLQCDSDARQIVGDAAVRRYARRLDADPGFRARFGGAAPIREGDADRLARYRLLGVDPASELIRQDLDGVVVSEGYWYPGFADVYETTEFLVLDDVIRADAALRLALADVAAKIHDARIDITSSGAERVAAVKAGGSDYAWYAFLRRLPDEIAAVPGGSARACSVVVERVMASPLER
jgi:hypothetical protein